MSCHHYLNLEGRCRNSNRGGRMLHRSWCKGRLASFVSLRRRWIQTEAKIAELGLKLPTIAAPKGNYLSYQRTGNLVYLSGHLPIPEDGPMVTGRLGENMTTEEGYEASKVVGLQVLATMKLNLGDLDRVAKVVKLFGVVNSTNDFTEQAKVMNGCSDLFHQVFGEERGKHVRTSIGTNVLPMMVPVEIDAIFEVKDGDFSDTSI